MRRDSALSCLETLMHPASRCHVCRWTFHLCILSARNQKEKIMQKNVEN